MRQTESCLFRVISTNMLQWPHSIDHYWHSPLLYMVLHIRITCTLFILNMYYWYELKDIHSFYLSTLNLWNMRWLFSQRNEFLSNSNVLLLPCTSISLHIKITNVRLSNCPSLICCIMLVTFVLYMLALTFLPQRLWLTFKCTDLHWLSTAEVLVPAQHCHHPHRLWAQLSLLDGLNSCVMTSILSLNGC